MFTKAAILSVLFAGSAFAAPTSSPRPNELERRADWQEGKCEAHIYLNTSNGLEIISPTSKWDVNIIDKSGSPMGHWDGTNPDHIQITTSKDEKWFVIQGGPDGPLNWGQVGMQNSITLSYDEQRWNGMDCYKYIQKSARPSNGWRHQYDWWCQFDC